jgi:hypothetical protein
LIGLLVKVLDIIPKSDISIKIERVSRTAHKVIIQNLGSLKISGICYEFHGRMIIDDLPIELDSNQIYESLIALSFETGRILDVKVSWRPQFGLLRKCRHIKQEVIG